MDLFHQLHEEQGKTILLITHSMPLALETERIITLADGRIIQDRQQTREEQLSARESARKSDR